MFDIGFWEMLFCAVLGLVVLGPEKLPSAIRSAAKFIKSAKNIAAQMTDELSKELDTKAVEKQLIKVKQQATKDLMD
ncbi:Sec-independent protein translocase protein TatB [Vibrio breoganii]|uniref:Twin-arginine translocase subunit TatB n=1 Tax=Vibrio breoganii TaxID=553239 RepID=A0ABX1UDY8_9VIBR|nr:Sec-independent protein translocase protein TatB [Vibrio breoganii]NMO75140.1 twin-arginine translocase subunit TatB [Vibrio breoganii]NMR71646.1 twin-arginine translocase subunit TatB [Vibrio breoganii]PMG02870.1 twin arginine-targeting protein translocase TatB [Vibrio breoganii]PMG96741.1 twin arginine-targeting protein translocase TatB [Vibrio breoganii]PML90368.1 twin arginine-targeting protein translocase TatB [Vibrio breoganii]